MPKKDSRRRNKTLILFLFSALIFLFFMGWSMYFVGEKKKPKKAKHEAPKEDKVTLLPIILEDNPQIPNE